MSFASNAGVTAALWRKAWLITICFSTRFTSQSRAKSAASQFSSSGWLGHSPCEPKSFTVFTRPVPNIIAQKRFTATRAVSGCCGEASHCARSRRVRRLVEVVAGLGRNAGNAASTLSPFLSYAPRTLMNVSRGFSISAMTITLGMSLSKSVLALRASSAYFFAAR